MEVLRSAPHLTIEKLAARFAQSSRRAECDRAAEIAVALGTSARKILTQKLHGAQPGEAVSAIGLLSRLDLPAMEAILLERIKSWGRPAPERRHCAARPGWLAGAKRAAVALLPV